MRWLGNAIAQVEAAKGYGPPSPDELKPKLGAWGRVLADIPDEDLTDALNAALGSWDFAGNVPFSPSVIKSAWVELCRTRRAEAEAQARVERARHRDTYACWHCCDLGHQPVWQFAGGHWRSALRPCQCDAAPFAYRNVSALSTAVYARHPITGEYALKADLIEHGAPNHNWHEVVNALRQEPATGATSPLFPTENGEPLPF